MERAEKEYDKYNQTQMNTKESDFDKAVKNIEAAKPKSIATKKKNKK